MKNTNTTELQKIEEMTATISVALRNTDYGIANETCYQLLLFLQKIKDKSATVDK